MNTEHEKENLFINLWNGKSPLWVAYWIWGMLVGNILGFLLIATLGVFGLLIFMPYVVWISVSVWRCAFNTRWIGWGYIARILVVIAFISTLSMFDQLNKNSKYEWSNAATSTNRNSSSFDYIDNNKPRILYSSYNQAFCGESYELSIPEIGNCIRLKQGVPLRVIRDDLIHYYVMLPNGTLGYIN